MSESAWKWGGYRRGMGRDGDDPRIIYAVKAIKKELLYNGFGAGKLKDDSKFGGATEKAVKKFQKSVGLKKDGIVGPKTANALWKKRIEEQDIPNGWLRAQIHWESADDPGAQFTNPDGTRDRGLTQLNNEATGTTDAEAFNPEFAINRLAKQLRSAAKQYRNCAYPDEWRLAVGRHRTPVGAGDWCDDPDTVPNKDGTWAEKAAYYVERVDTFGRLGWVG